MTINKILFFFGILVLVLLISRGIKIVHVKTNSMSDYIQPHDLVAILKLNNYLFFDEISKFDPVAFYKDIEGESYIYIKRVVATELDTIFIGDAGLTISKDLIPHDPVFNYFISENKENNTLLVNGKDYYSFLTDQTNNFQIEYNYDSTKNAFKVPDDFYFVVGDNYHQSMDSRFWGFIHKDQIIGKALVVF